MRIKKTIRIASCSNIKDRNLFTFEDYKNDKMYNGMIQNSNQQQYNHFYN